MMAPRRTLASLCVFGLALGFLAGSVLAAPVKIKVVSDNAVVRLRPDPGSEVVAQKLAVGTVYDEAVKTGEWYEIKYQSDIGVLITGFIHEKDVEVVKAAAPAFEPRPSERVSPAGTEKPKRMALTIGGGMVGGAMLDGTSAYSSIWSNNLLKTVGENGTIGVAAKKPMVIGFSLAYFLTDRLGVGLRLDYLPSQDISGASQFGMNWEFTSGTKGSASDQWTSSGDLSVMPISLNAIYSLGGAGMFRPYLTGGLTFFTGSVKASSTMGYAFTYSETINNVNWQYIDYIDLPVRVDESLSAFGFNAGGGLDVMFAKSVGLNIDVAYCFGKASDLKWKFQPGTYNGNFATTKSFSFTDADFAESISEIPLPEVKLSFLRIQAGVKILL